MPGTERVIAFSQLAVKGLRNITNQTASEKGNVKEIHFKQVNVN
jgi:hypothetical protein